MITKQAGKISVSSLYLLCVLCGAGQAACGRKGPPLAPIVYLPRPVTELSAKRVDDDIVIQFRVPAANTDSSSPADLDRIEVYAHTGPLPATADFLKYGTLVQSIDIKQPVVRKPEEPGAESKGTAAAGAASAPPADAAATPADTATGVKPYTPELAGAPAEAAAEAGPAAPKQTAEAAAKAGPAAPKQSAEAAAEAGPAAPKQSAEAAAEAGPAAPKQTAEAAAKAGMIEQGWVTSVRETLTEKHMEIGPMPPTRPVVQPVAPVQIETLETPGTVNFPLPPTRYYTVVGVSRSRNRRGPFAGPLRVPLVSPLQPPDKIDTTYTESAISLAWPGQPEDVEPAVVATAPATPPAGVEPIGDPNQETPGTHEIYADLETEGTQDAPWPAAAPASKPQPPPTPRFGYNVYDASAIDASTVETEASPASPKAAAPVLPLNAALLTAPVFNDPRVEFGTERCYVVRRVEMVGAVAIESAPSPPACVTPLDKFPPAAPKAVTSVASGTAVSLIWDANTETDLGGYLVLRGEAPGDKLAPLTPAPIGDASYVDTSVRRNRTYVYEVVAVDKTGNQSAPSNRVEEPIR